MTLREFFSRVREMLIGRTAGPLAFRFILQPLASILFAIRSGLHDARAGRPPFLSRSMFARPARRSELLRQMWGDIYKVFIVALLLDVIYSMIVHRWIYPGQTILVAVVLTIAPYLLLRGPVTRIARLFNQDGGRPHDQPK